MAIVTSKACCRCGVTKDAGEFYRLSSSADGLGFACKPCLAERRRGRRGIDRTAELAALAARPTKPCGKCGAERARADFAARSLSHDGLSPWCKDCNRAYSREHYQANREKKNAQALAWYEANYEARRAQIRAYAKANRPRLYAKSREYIKAHREEVTEWHRRRRAQIRAVTIGPIDLDALWTGGCGICGEVLDRSLMWPDPASKTIDHIVPISRGGAHTQSNLQWSHWECNNRKGARLDVEGVAQLGDPA